MNNLGMEGTTDIEGREGMDGMEDMEGIEDMEGTGGNFDNKDEWNY
jgi:hypothetical protein